MKNDARSMQRLLRCYPPAWRQRYGDELIALLEDTRGAGRLPRRTWLTTARSGLIERVRAGGFGPDPLDDRPEVRSRSGSLLILSAWACVTLGGAMFAKFNENWMVGTPRPDRILPTVGYDMAQGAAALGLLTLMVAALITLPALTRALRKDGWALVRRQVRAVIVIGGAAVLVTAPVLAWAQHLSTRQRNGGLDIYTAAFFAVCLCGAATVVTVTAAAVSILKTVEIPRRSLRWLGRLGLLLSLAMGAVLSGLVLWWIPLAANAPSVLGGRIPLDLVLAGALMGLGCLTAIVGARRVVANPLP